MGARKVETDSAGYWRGFQWDRTEGVCVQTTLVHNESQSAWVEEACAAGR